MTWRVWLRLGRISNLPTVWTNGLAGWLLANGMTPTVGLLPLFVALSLFYVGGMYLNDAFDATIDARERTNRPIPMGEVNRSTVFIVGSAMLSCGALLLFTLGTGAGICGLVLIASIVLYNWWHKRTVWGPIIMGLCRLLTYATAVIASGGEHLWPAMLGALGLFCHVVGLTYAAKQEAYNRLGSVWPLAVLAIPVLILLAVTTDALTAIFLLVYVAWGAWALRLLFRRRSGDVPRAVVSLIAAIALFDAVLIASLGAVNLAVMAIAAFFLTLALQKLAPGT